VHEIAKLNMVNAKIQKKTYSLAVNYYKYTIENLTQLIKYKKSQIFASICPCKDVIDNESTISLL